MTVVNILTCGVNVWYTLRTSLVLQDGVIDVLSHLLGEVQIDCFAFLRF